MGEDEFDGVLDGDDNAGAVLRDALDHRGQGGGFAGAGDPGYQHEPAAELANFLDDGVVPQRAEFRDVLRDVAEGRLMTAAGDVDIATEAADSFKLQRIVQLPILLQRGPL